MPDYLKEMAESLAEGVFQLLLKDANQRAINTTGPGRTVGANVAVGGANGFQVQDFFTTGLGLDGQTTVAFLPDFSAFDSDEILTT